MYVANTAFISAMPKHITIIGECKDVTRAENMHIKAYIHIDNDMQAYSTRGHFIMRANSVNMAVTIPKVYTTVKTSIPCTMTLNNS